jgi:ACS family glucarate transporter-like MFS transporter
MIKTNAAETGRTKVRYSILFMLFALTVINYADRATLSITGTSVAKDLGMDAVALGFVFSAFGWSYAIGQIPGGWLLDRFGSKRVYAWSLFLWSLFTLLQGFVESISVVSAVMTLFFLRFMLGLVESPAFPANGRIVATWFPTAERGFATAVFNSAQYFATVLFAPLMGWITHVFGWHYVFIVMGSLGLLLTVIWVRVIHEPKQHPRINAAELAFIEEGGALVNMDQTKKAADKAPEGPKLSYLKQLLTNRMLLGVYIGQYCITALTYFFITWFPIYLIKGRGMSILQVGFVAALPAICGFSGGILGGILSDFLLRRGYSVTVARKMPFVVGMSLATTLVICNFLDAQWAVIAVMALAFFGKGLAAIGWAVIADASPKEIIGLTGGVFNGLGNVAGIITPIVIGYILHVTGSFEGALYFVAAHSLLAIFSYLVIVGEIKRFELKKPEPILSPLSDAKSA